MTWIRRRGPLLLLLLLYGCGLLFGWSLPARAMDESDRLWMVGANAFQDGLYPLSRRVLERFVERFPADKRLPEATLLLGKAHLFDGAFESALQAFRKAQSFSPQPGKPEEARFWEAETLFRMKRYTDARGVYDKVLAAEPASPLAADALYGLGWAHLELKRREQAAADFRRLVTTYPQHAAAGSATFYLARTLVELKRADDAVELLRAFPAKYPDHRLLPDARYLLGQALLAGGHPDEGVAELRAFLAAYPGHELATPARRVVVDTLFKQGRKAELAEEYKRLTTQSPPAAEGLYDAGFIAKRLGRPRDADQAWARLRKEFPDHPLAGRAAFDLAQAAFGKNNFKDAAALFRTASRSPEEAVRGEALVLLGESELKLRRFAPALQAFESAVEVPGLEPALRFRALAGSGLALEEQRQWAKAARYYEEVASKSPDKTLQSWAKQRLAAIQPRLKPAAVSKPAPKPSTPKTQGAGGRP